MKSIIQRIAPFLGELKLPLIAAALCSIPLAAIKWAQTYLVKDVFDRGFSPDATMGDAVELAAILVGLQLLNYPFRFYHFYGMRMGMERVTAKIRKKLLMKMQSLPISFFSDQKVGNLTSITLMDTLVFSESLRHMIALFREPLTAMGLFAYALYIDWKLTMIIACAIPIFLLVFRKSGKMVRKYQGQVQESFALMNHNISEILSGQKIIKSFNIQDYTLKRFARAQDQFLNSQKKTSLVEENAHPMVEMIGAFAFAGIIVYARFRIGQGELTTGGFVSFVAAMAMIMDPIRKYSAANVKMNQARAASNRIFSILDLPEEEDLGKTHIQGFKDKIEIINLDFSYGDQLVLKNFSMTLKKGEKLGLVGMSGSGKSTLIKLLLRLYPVERGKILVDGVDINDIPLVDFRSLFALVSQDIFLFNDTIAENITLGEEISQEVIERSLQISYSHDFISEMKDGIETSIGDRGTKVSGGQAQRLTIARAYLKNSPILLLDEATSALDNESEKIVQQALDKVSGDKTVITIAHRLSTIKDYDKIIVLRDGKIIEEGNHQELIELNGEYFKLYNLS